MLSVRPWCALIALPLAACQALPQTTVPENLIAPCPHPVVDVRTTEGLTQGLLDYHAALTSCNDDKSAIRSHLAPKGAQPERKLK